MTLPFFHHLAEQVADFIGAARHTLRIAVCWFSHRSIYESLLEQVQRGVQVELLIEYDTQNIHTEGLDFQRLIDAGVRLYARQLPGLMHHKFVVADETRLLTGSFNWTYNSNAENLLFCDDPPVVSAFLHAFEQEKEAAQPILLLQKVAPRPFAVWALFQNSHFELATLRSRIMAGACVWRVRIGLRVPFSEISMETGQWVFDPVGITAPFWTHYPTWNAAAFQQWWEIEKKLLPKQKANAIAYSMMKMQKGDILLAENRKGIITVGIVQGAPEASLLPGGRFSSGRAVQWLRFFDPPCLFPRPPAPSPVSRFNGSALALVHALFKEE